MNEQDVAREVSEDRRLVALGIDPDGDPVDRMLAVRRKLDEMQRRIEGETKEVDTSPAE